VLCPVQQVVPYSLAFKAILAVFFYLFFILFFRVLEHIKGTSLDRFGEKTSFFGV